jgi:hypothetical protein
MRSFAPAELNSEHAWRALLGRKVSLRYRLHGDSEHPFSEAVGMVSFVGPGEGDRVVIRVVNRRGETVSAGLEDVLAAREL